MPALIQYFDLLGRCLTRIQIQIRQIDAFLKFLSCKGAHHQMVHVNLVVYIRMQPVHLQVFPADLVHDFKLLSSLVEFIGHRHGKTEGLIPEGHITLPFSLQSADLRISGRNGIILSNLH